MLSTTCWVIINATSYIHIEGRVYLRKEDAAIALPVMQDHPSWKRTPLSIAPLTLVLAYGATDSQVSPKVLLETCHPCKEVTPDERAARDRYIESLTEEQRASPQEKEQLLKLWGVQDDGIDALIRWRDAATDRWGEDLLFLLLHEFSPDNLHSDVPPEHQNALRAFRALSEHQKVARIKKVLGDGVE